MADKGLKVEVRLALRSLPASRKCAFVVAFREYDKRWDEVARTEAGPECVRGAALAPNAAVPAAAAAAATAAGPSPRVPRRRRATAGAPPTSTSPARCG